MNSESLVNRWENVRERSLAIAATLTAEDAVVQSMPDASPTKWHLAHTTWFFETFILETIQPEFKPFNPIFRTLFNSYYNGIGEQFSRPQRGMLTRPDLTEVLRYRRAIDQAIRQLSQQHPSQQLFTLLELGIQHEQQHQELMLTDIKHLLSCNPMCPAMLDNADLVGIVDAVVTSDRPMEWRKIESNLIEVGHHGEGFCFDNETPRHREFIESFFIASQLVTNEEYLEFIEAGGYHNPSLWLSDGWDWVQKEQVRRPLYWRKDDHDGWLEFSLAGLAKLDPAQPVCHLSYFEASAYATWLGARLPTEAEWEVAAEMEAQGSHQVQHLFDGCWQWTSSSYSPYPGYAPTAGALGEYNGKFMVNQYVLRGSSVFTPKGHSRLTYRNFFPAVARWQRTGIRLAKDCKGSV